MNEIIDNLGEYLRIEVPIPIWMILIGALIFIVLTTFAVVFNMKAMYYKADKEETVEELEADFREARQFSSITHNEIVIRLKQEISRKENLLSNAQIELDNYRKPNKIVPIVDKPKKEQTSTAKVGKKGPSTKIDLISDTKSVKPSGRKPKS